MKKTKQIKHFNTRSPAKLSVRGEIVRTLTGQELTVVAAGECSSSVLTVQPTTQLQSPC